MTEPDSAVVLVDHGSRLADANHVLEAIADRVREQLPGRRVVAAHMELAAPSLEDAIESCVAAGAREVVVQPYFLAPGRHSSRDIPQLAESIAARHPGLRIRVSAPLGVHDGLVAAVLDRLRERAGG